MNWIKQKISLPDDLCVPGIQPVLQALSQITNLIEVIFIKNHEADKNPRVQQIMDFANKNRVPIRITSNEEPFPMDHMHHQGVLAILKNSFEPTQSENELFELYEHSPPSLVVALDRITDPHNLGAISRSCLFFGCKHILLEQKYSPPIGSTVHKTSSGSSLSINYFVVSSLQSTLRQLTDVTEIVTSSTTIEKSIPLGDWKPKIPSLLVLGSEGFGIRDIISKISTKKVYIPGTSQMDSLNVSVSAGIFLQKYYSIHK